MMRLDAIREISKFLPECQSYYPVLYPYLFAHLKKLVRCETHHLLEEGEIYKPDECMFCGKDRPLEVHHIEYSVEGARMVEFLCHKCHQYIHEPGNEDVLL